MDKDKIKRSVITRAATWAILLQALPLIAAFNNLASAKETEKQPTLLPTDCIPEPASPKNTYILGANC